ncbi:glutamate carboxypeptidase [Agromyces flavus]|uniref:Glutamate carboxypeptidase n=1 Tax=Agromyces flavus TaxID=589382 RepID=A0A1H1XKM2_9MICO|nr:M20/M25/M40 family metallo-hydrolase [Agromyces flavus]MCP2366443.1 glutamate carboxypeptidase [Agromyces flavus]GGI44686.1 glutamate carboxypeptidase [Agromyces flavus]SDT09778.1 glutamate carboxypeptidase [Agromyces flavus]
MADALTRRPAPRPFGRADVAARAAPTADELRRAACALDARFRDDLAVLVGIDSGSHDPDGVDRVAAWAAASLVRDGFDVETLPTPPRDERRYGPVVVGRRRGRGAARIVMFAHMDTVFPAGTAAARPFRIEGERASGPGVCDDAAGIAAGLSAARVLDAVAYDGYGELVLVLTPDEEVGSPASRELLAAAARGADAALCLECARENGDLVGARKGVADVLVTIRGRAAHSGVEPERGINAAVEAARFLLDVQALSGSRPGLTVNVGRVASGSRPNIVPESAELHLEVRAEALADLVGALDAIDERARHPFVDGAGITVTRLDVCPPLERDATDGLASLARETGARLGLGFEVAATGGASDANFVAALGVPTLDGLGPVGGGDHGTDEWLDLGSVPDRVALLAGLVVAIAEAEGESVR